MDKQSIIKNVKSGKACLLGALVALLLGGGGFVSSCSDWDDHYEGNDQAGTSATLWQLMKSNQQLSDFCQVLEQTKVFRMHRKTGVSYSQLLDGGQAFTVVAPVNGTFNRDSLLRLVQTNQGDSVVEKFFVLNHLSRSSSSIKDGSQTLLMLNAKHAVVQNGKIEGISVSQPNIHAKNGVLHVVSQPLPFTHNLYEALCDLPDMSTIGSFLRLYEEDYFDADHSVSIGLVEGVPVYIDSVMIERNRMLQNIGLLNAEDSTYWVVAPTTAGWQKAWDEASKYFVYDEKTLKRDSLQQYWTNRALLDDAVFNMSDQRSTSDSLVSVPWLNWRKTWKAGRPINHVFHQPFAAGGILHGADAVSCSNGILYKVDQWPFTPEQTFFKEIWAEGETTWLITNEKECSYNSRRQVADSISDNAYLQILPRTNLSNWELTFRVDNTLSGCYDICLVLLPKSVSNQSAPDVRPCKFKATINYVDERGVAQTDNCGNTQFQNNPERVDTIVLAEAFQFPACNYDQNELKVSLKIQCSILARETARFAREMYLDCIYLRPRKSANNQ
ncbi:MAG: fasciclin domain-containing protein [Prevotella sp.]|nr:fasciclin domain-containing protein [Prevotella sp.]